MRTLHRYAAARHSQFLGQARFGHTCRHAASFSPSLLSLLSPLQIYSSSSNAYVDIRWPRKGKRASAIQANRSRIEKKNTGGKIKISCFDSAMRIGVRASVLARRGPVLFEKSVSGFSTCKRISEPAPIAKPHHRTTACFSATNVHASVRRLQVSAAAYSPRQVHARLSFNGVRVTYVYVLYILMCAICFRSRR